MSATTNNLGVAFPLRLDSAGQAAAAPTPAAAVEQLIEELLFTTLGERLNRPDLGCGLLELVFEPSSDELQAATQFQVNAELQRWLGDLIRVLSVVTQASGSELATTVVYALLADGVTRTVVYGQ
jgi:phage baseplate assembly protein W